MDKATQAVPYTGEPTEAQHDAVTRLALRRFSFGRESADEVLAFLAHLGIDPREVQARWKAQRGAA